MSKFLDNIKYLYYPIDNNIYCKKIYLPIDNNNYDKIYLPVEDKLKNVDNIGRYNKKKRTKKNHNIKNKLLNINNNYKKKNLEENNTNLKKKQKKVRISELVAIHNI